MISSEFDCFAIAGDFNIHIDNAEIKTTKEIVTVLNTFECYWWYCTDKGQQEEWQTKIILEKINSSSEYEKTMQKSWADVAEDETRNTL